MWYQSLQHVGSSVPTTTPPGQGVIEQRNGWDAWTAVGGLLTGVAALAVAVIGGLWAIFRYRREEPHLPRVNADITAELNQIDGVDYLSFTVDIKHLAGGILFLDTATEDGRPLVTVRRLLRPETSGAVPAEDIATCPVLER